MGGGVMVKVIEINIGLRHQDSLGAQMRRIAYCATQCVKLLLAHQGGGWIRQWSVNNNGQRLCFSVYALASML